ncbi:MAG TPA: hypothetical protein VNK04_17245 [Gemmataceae bacterium]|nr:hypothetical protein [Gemmataceae bacterium]
MDNVTLEKVEALAAQLSPEDRRRLAEKILRDLAAEAAPGKPRPGRSWSEIRGIVAYPMFGEDAQQWVSRTRREADEHREKQWRSIR